jgi:8-amino-7-oxononanoate synthase
MAHMDFLERELSALDDAGLRRQLREVGSAQAREITLNGQRVLNFCSNNYLGLASHPVVTEAAHAALREWGLGSGASRLIVGNQRVHEAVEAQLAGLVHTQAALLFNSGYHANLGVIPALVGDGDTIYSDELNHASLIDGCRLSRAAVEVYRHLDLEHLADALGRAGGDGRRLIVTDGVFSMDGDRSPVAELSQLAGQHGAMLMVDEAHSVGVLGERGQGLCHEAGVEPDVRMGTLGKAVGGFGAFIAGSAVLREYLLNRGRTFVYTTALPAAVVAAAGAAVGLIRGPEGTARRSQLFARISELSSGLERLGLLMPGSGSTPVFPVLVSDAGRVMQCSERLLEAGIYAQGIRPPTVPRGTSRLRFALMADHTEEDIARVLDALGALQHAKQLSQTP